jgi:hypothetical protein
MRSTLAYVTVGLLTTAFEARAHSTIQQIVYNGVTYPLYAGVRKPNNNYNMDILDPNVSCKVDVNLPEPVIVPVKAGTTIYLQWHHEPDGGQAGDSEDPGKS